MSQPMIINLIKSLVIISTLLIYLVDCVLEIDYKVYAFNASIEIDKLFQNLTPDYLGSNIRPVILIDSLLFNVQGSNRPL